MVREKVIVNIINSKRKEHSIKYGNIYIGAFIWRYINKKLYFMGKMNQMVLNINF